MDKLVSIIISVYNKEEFLKECIESLIHLKIDHKQIEAIFVDDCSTDRSLEIIESYAKDHDFIQIISLPSNTGSPSEPRNVGMKQATGKYITLLDADDWLDTDGFPKFIHKVNEDDADFGLGRSFKHSSKGVAHHARFTTYKDASHVKPEEIIKIFRAVGPPGKVFKRELIEKHQIAFEHMKFGEDKLFFTELISKVEDITMSTTPVYHVNRFDENESLVKETSVIDKAYLNKDILERVCEMELPEQLNKLALNRIIELDFFRRFLHTKTFLKSEHKEAFYELIDEVEAILKKHHYDMKDFLDNPIFINMYNLYQLEGKADFLTYTRDAVHGRWHFYIEDNVVYKVTEHKIEGIKPISEGCYPVYEGTQMIDGSLVEVIRVLKPESVEIKRVSAVAMRDVQVAKDVEFDYHDGRLYIKQDQFAKMPHADVNLCVYHDDLGLTLVHASYPSNNERYKMKRQKFKLEFVDRIKEKKDAKYINKITGPMILTRKANLYKDVGFVEALQSLEPGTKVNPTSISHTSKGTPRLVLEDGSIMTANKDFVTKMNTTKLDKYITDIPKRIKVKKACKLYGTRAFNQTPVKDLAAGEQLNISNILYTDKSTPRLVTEDGNFLTANKDYIEVIE
ncbi:glycosyltransferase family 2 protein [Mammaliicoccus sp. Dog046]|uniref:glycosyltransferase family 2 protein n=1 Tax=Mammaliicoccus sp. Dog046 TaxID=3034233 RepID=UPI002B260512|nr:glycosyltransferase family 2 protein [Mammaliicoccus sp. Dog046]WQK85613.1 glycosyltransferase family 2 protein [Mammaliicoccus sp. Dog046]